MWATKGLILPLHQNQDQRPKISAIWTARYLRMLNRRLFLKGECVAELSSKEKSRSHAWEIFGQCLIRKVLEKLWWENRSCESCHVVLKNLESMLRSSISMLFLKYIQQRDYFPSTLSNFSFLSLLLFSRTATQKTYTVIAFSVKSLDFVLFIFLLLNWFRENFKVTA